MRISDWSSDVCSSDLDRPRRGCRRGQRGHARRGRRRAAPRPRRAARQARLGRSLPRCDAQEKSGGEEQVSDRYTDKPFLRFVEAWVLKAIGQDWKSAVSGKSVSVRVDMGGRGIIKKK